jgi:putative endonuclease
MTTRSYTLYILECVNGAFYTGVTTDLERRYEEHFSKKGAKYTRAFPPVRILASWDYITDYSTILRLEAFVKRLTKEMKAVLIENPGLFEKVV